MDKQGDDVPPSYNDSQYQPSAPDQVQLSDVPHYNNQQQHKQYKQPEQFQSKKHRQQHQLQQQQHFQKYHQPPKTDNVQESTHQYTTTASDFRADPQIPDPSTKSGKLFTKMAAVVGAHNILPPSSSLTTEDDKKRWLKSDSNSLLYFWYKSPKARADIASMIDKGCCYHSCMTSIGDCSGEGCISTCGISLFSAIPFCWPILCCCPANPQTLAVVRPMAALESSEAFQWSSRIFYRDEREYAIYTPSTIDSCSPTPTLTREKFDALYSTFFLKPINDAGFNYSNCWTCCQFYFSICSHRYPAQQQHIWSTYSNWRYGKKLPLRHFVHNADSSATWSGYKSSCFDDINHPNAAITVIPSGLSMTTNTEIKLGKLVSSPQSNSGMYYGPPLGWLGEREIQEESWAQQVPFADLNLKELDYVIESHNNKWGKIKQLDPNGLDLAYIFPGQNK